MILGPGKQNVTEDLPLEDLEAHPLFLEAYRAWQSSVEAGTGGKIDPIDMPRDLLPAVMLIEMLPEMEDGILRLAGTFVCEVHHGEMRGRYISDFFEDADAKSVAQAMRQCIETNTPSLARRSYVSLDGSYWEYVRFLLPEVREGKPPRIFKAMDRKTLKRIPM